MELVTKQVVSTVRVCVLLLPLLSVDAFASDRAGVIIVCPYIPDGLSEVPICDGKQATCVGTVGHDIIWGTDSSDVIVAGPGNDVVQSDAGDDTVCAGSGNDSIHGARGRDTLFGEDGDDSIFGAVDDDVLSGGRGDFDVLWGGPGHDDLDGGPGNNDVCLSQRDGAEIDLNSCEAIYPPIGYQHNAEHELGPGIIGPR